MFKDLSKSGVIDKQRKSTNKRFLSNRKLRKFETLNFCRDSVGSGSVVTGTGAADPYQNATDLLKNILGALKKI